MNTFFVFLNGGTGTVKTCCRQLLSVALMAMLVFNADPARAQPEVQAWGNIKGVRVEGELMMLESSIRVVYPGWGTVKRTDKERQNPRFTTEGLQKITETRIDSIMIKQVVSQKGAGEIEVDLMIEARADTTLAGVYFSLDLPATEYGSGTVELVGAAPVSLSAMTASGADELIRVVARGLRFSAARRLLDVGFDEPTEVVVRRGSLGGKETVQVYLALMSGEVKTTQTSHKVLTLGVSGETDRNPVTFQVDMSRTGRPFAGFGGNFRLQNPETDPPVIQYCLDNLRLAWGRVEMPWRFWHENEDEDPVANARSGKLHPRVHAAMEMAQRLHKLGMPVIVSDWSAPNWAIEGEFTFRRQPGDPWGNPLNQSKAEKIYASITAYIQFLKEEYGVEAAMFSFNESDLGIYVRQTGEEHAKLIRELGAYMKGRGLKTKMLLGDTADANGWAFTYPAMNDPETHPYIGAVSFHSWRGFETETLEKWHDIATKLNIPLVVGEGSMDAAAWRYPAIFEEPVYAMEEADLYTRILAICQPLSILQWQLTADYSPMAGGGVFGNTSEPLRPTRRFWNFKQLASTPEGLLSMPLSVDQANISCAALGDPRRGRIVLHMVNNGATRQAIISGLPQRLRELRMYVTDTERNMEEMPRVRVRQGTAQFELPAAGYTTLMSR